MPLSPEFNRAEALDLVALSAIVEGGEAPPQPTDWTMIFDSPVIGQFTPEALIPNEERRPDAH